MRIFEGCLTRTLAGCSTLLVRGCLVVPLVAALRLLVSALRRGVEHALDSEELKRLFAR